MVQLEVSRLIGALATALTGTSRQLLPEPPATIARPEHREAGRDEVSAHLVNLPWNGLTRPEPSPRPVATGSGGGGPAGTLGQYR